MDGDGSGAVFVILPWMSRSQKSQFQITITCTLFAGGFKLTSHF